LGGAEIKDCLPAAMALLLLEVVQAYGALASRVSRVRLLDTTTLFVMVTLVLFWLWGLAAGVASSPGPGSWRCRLQCFGLAFVALRG
jgi:hypothetical protein